MRLVTVKEGDHAIVQKVGCRDRRLAIIELGASNLGVSVDERLLIAAPDPLQIADINVSWAPQYPGCSLSNSPWASFSVLAFSSATSWPRSGLGLPGRSWPPVL